MSTVSMVAIITNPLVMFGSVLLVSLVVAELGGVMYRWYKLKQDRKIMRKLLDDGILGHVYNTNKDI